METVQLECAHCGTPFQKESKEYRRQIKSGKNKFFCGLSCNAFARNKANPPKGNPQNFVGHTRRDEYTPFRWFILRAEYRGRNKNRDCSVTVEYLKQLWELQNGICPITGWKLILPVDTGKGFVDSRPDNASIDRIDNSQGYVQGNIRFISLMANIGRQSFTDKQLIDFCKAVVSNHV